MRCVYMRACTALGNRLEVKRRRGAACKGGGYGRSEHKITQQDKMWARERQNLLAAGC